MKHEILHLKDYYPQLGANGCDAALTTYLPGNLSEINREHEKTPLPTDCPGGGYEFCSQREQEPIAFYFLPDGINVFVLNYSVAPHRYPTQLREVAAAMELIYQNAEAWHCDTARIAIMGFSAGGHLAAHTRMRMIYRKSGHRSLTANPCRHQFFAIQSLQQIRFGHILVVSML